MKVILPKYEITHIHDYAFQHHLQLRLSQHNYSLFIIIGLVKHTFGEGNCHPLQYSYLENAINRGAWWAMVKSIGHNWSNLANILWYTYAIKYYWSGRRSLYLNKISSYITEWCSLSFSYSVVPYSVTAWTAARLSLSFTISQSLLNLTPIESWMMFKFIQLAVKQRYL